MDEMYGIIRAAMQYSQLNRDDITPEDERYSEAWRRVLGRLGDYTAIIVRAMNMRPDAVTVLEQTTAHMLVRISTPLEHAVLRIAPDSDLAGEVYFGRMLTAHHLPAARIIHYDLTCSLVPFTYTLESYVGGVNAVHIAPDHLLHAAARQVGRTLRKMHRIKVRGWGRPNIAGRWPTPDWHTILMQLHTQFVLAPADALVFNEEERAIVLDILQHPALDNSVPHLMHGAPGPQTTRCTIGEHVHLEALINPGMVVGGDGLLDLALGMDSAYPEAWRIGLLEGYVAMVPLSAAEQERLRLLRILACYWKACWAYMRAEPHETARDQMRVLLAKVKM